MGYFFALYDLYPHSEMQQADETIRKQIKVTNLKIIHANDHNQETVYPTRLALNKLQIQIDWHHILLLSIQDENLTVFLQ